jgi:putative acetyltransferase
MTTIRKIQRSDNERLAAMIRKVFEEHDAPRHGTVYSDPTTDDLYTLFLFPGSVLWVAEADGKVAGCCGIYPTPGLPAGYAELVKYYLAGNARGRGIGKELMEKSVASAKELGYTHLYLESLPHYAKAVSIYEKQGFLNLPAPLGNSGHTTCNIWMYKAL